jgi:hypothetical protein
VSSSFWTSTLINAPISTKIAEKIHCIDEINLREFFIMKLTTAEINSTTFGIVFQMLERRVGVVSQDSLELLLWLTHDRAGAPSSPRSFAFDSPRTRPPSPSVEEKRRREHRHQARHSYCGPSLLLATGHCDLFRFALSSFNVVDGSWRSYRAYRLRLIDSSRVKTRDSRRRRGRRSRAKASFELSLNSFAIFKGLNCPCAMEVG